VKFDRGRCNFRPKNMLQQMANAIGGFQELNVKPAWGRC